MEHPINIKIDHAHATADSRQGQGSGREMDGHTYLVKLLIIRVCRTITSINNYHVLIGQFTNGSNNISKPLKVIPITVLNFEIAHCILKIIKAISSYL